jgi:hypothetical protein
LRRSIAIQGILGSDRQAIEADGQRGDVGGAEQQFRRHADGAPEDGREEDEAGAGGAQGRAEGREGRHADEL